MKPTTKQHLDFLFTNWPQLAPCKPDVIAAWGFLYNCYKKQGKMLVCGNGGSAADADHIVGELMNRFALQRPILPEHAQKLSAQFGADAKLLTGTLQRGLSAINLASQGALLTAVANDLAPDLIFAQQVYGYGRKGDVLLAITTSGNSPNVLNAARVARVLDMRVIGLTGESGGALVHLCDACLRVPANMPCRVQELHQPIYHVLCQMLEQEFFGE